MQILHQMASVREQVSWVTENEDDATAKAKSLTAAAINRVNYHESLETREADVHPDMLVVGGGLLGDVPEGAQDRAREIASSVSSSA